MRLAPANVRHGAGQHWNGSNAPPTQGTAPNNVLGGANAYRSTPVDTARRTFEAPIFTASGENDRLGTVALVLRGAIHWVSMEEKKNIFPALIGLGAVARLLPHPWNFTPMMALGLYAGAKSTKLRTGVLVTLFALLLSDSVMGFYRGMWYVYAASLVPVLLGRFIRRKDSVSAIVPAALLSSLSFFAITNFMVWATGHMYPRTASGLGACFVAGLPFYRNQLLGDVFYTVALFGGHAFLSRLVRPLPRIA